MAGTEDTARATGELDGAGVRGGEAGIGILISRPSHLCPAEEFSTVRSAGDFILRGSFIELRSTADTSLTRLMRGTCVRGEVGSTMRPVDRIRTVYIPEPAQNAALSTLARQRQRELVSPVHHMPAADSTAAVVGA